MPLRTIDLCAGIGGIRRGFEMTGYYKNVLSAEIDKYACLTYEHLYHENPKNDLTSDEFKDLVANTEYEERFTPPIDDQQVDKMTVMMLEMMGIKVEPKALIYYSANDPQEEKQKYGLWL